MPIFAVILNNEFPDIEKRLKTLNPIKIGPAAYLVRSDDALTSDIAVMAGLKGEGRDLAGVVLGLNQAYSGWHKTDVWEWLGRYAP